MSLILSDVNGLRSMWYPPTYISISPTCQFEVKDYPSWKNVYMSSALFIQVCAAIYPESGVSKEGDNCHLLGNATTDLNKAASRTFILSSEKSKNGVSQADPDNPFRQYKTQT